MSTTDVGVKKGDRFRAMGAEVEVRRVGGDKTWADIKVTQPHGATWTKRQPLPFPKDWTRITPMTAGGPDYTIHPGVFWKEVISESPLTQAQIAGKMGISQKHLSRIVGCHALPGVAVTLAFATVLEISPQMMWRLCCDYQMALELGLPDLTPDYL